METYLSMNVPFECANHKQSVPKSDLGYLSLAWIYPLSAFDRTFTARSAHLVPLTTPLPPLYPLSAFDHTFTARSAH